MSTRADELHSGEPQVLPTLINWAPDLRARYIMGAAYMDRGFDEYSEAFGFNLECFKGMRLLDVGAGHSAKFIQEARAHGIDAYAVNPSWGDDGYRQDAIEKGLHRENPEETVRPVAGIVQELPFQDESFDVVISYWGVPVYLPGTETNYRKAFSEINRVLAPGGLGLFYPISRASYEQPVLHTLTKEAFGDSYEYLDKRGIPKLLVTKEPIAKRAKLVRAIKPLVDRSTPLDMGL